MRSEIHDQRGEARSEKLERDDPASRRRLRSRSSWKAVARALSGVDRTLRFRIVQRHLSVGVGAHPDLLGRRWYLASVLLECLGLSLARD